MKQFQTIEDIQDYLGQAELRDGGRTAQGQQELTSQSNEGQPDNRDVKQKYPELQECSIF